MARPRGSSDEPRPEPAGKGSPSPGAEVTEGAGTGLDGERLKRCLAGAAREPGRRRGRTVARCLGIGVAELRRQVTTACRESAKRARDPRAAERRCRRSFLG